MSSLAWKPYAVGDIWIGTPDAPVLASWFGGGDDREDDGQTASGILNDGSDPTLLGCALPLPTCLSTKGSLLPVLPYRLTLVEFTAVPSGIKLACPLIDVGPALDAPDHAAADLTQAAFKGLGGDLKDGLIKVIIRIIGAAKHLI